MIKIEMEVSTRNYLVRILENYKSMLKKTKMHEKDLEYELKQIELANRYLFGKKVDISLGKTIVPTSYSSEDNYNEH